MSLFIPSTASMSLLCCFHSLFALEGRELENNGMHLGLVPAFNIIYFHGTLVPLSITGLSIRGLLGQKVFWLLMLLMVSAGAAEQAMSQWSSAFAEAGLRVDKTIGDLAGPCGFALLMGLARLLHGKYSEQLPLKQMMMGSTALCIVCYLLAGLSANPVLGLIGCSVRLRGHLLAGTAWLLEHLPAATAMFAFWHWPGIWVCLRANLGGICSRCQQW